MTDLCILLELFALDVITIFYPVQVFLAKEVPLEQRVPQATLV